MHKVHVLVHLNELGLISFENWFVLDKVVLWVSVIEHFLHDVVLCSRDEIVKVFHLRFCFLKCPDIVFVNVFVIYWIGISNDQIDIVIYKKIK